MGGGHFLNVHYNSAVCFVVLIINFSNRLYIGSHIFSPPRAISKYRSLSSAFPLMLSSCSPSIPCCPQKGLVACSAQLRCPHSQRVPSTGAWHAISFVTHFKTMAVAIQTQNGEQPSGQQGRAGVTKGCGDLMGSSFLLLKLPSP